MRYESIASEVQLFQSIEKKENFLFLLGALVARVISLKKAAEVMQLEPAEFLKILDLMGIEFPTSLKSYLRLTNRLRIDILMNDARQEQRYGYARTTRKLLQ